MSAINLPSLPALNLNTPPSLAQVNEQARLPVMPGTAANVLDALEDNMGQGLLTLEHIAKQLCIHKRTLQRYLNQQETSFEVLRERVRFHYAVVALLEHNMSITQASQYLGFKDRTGFTAAFKRWTGMTPRFFQRLYRR